VRGVPAARCLPAESSPACPLKEAPPMPHSLPGVRSGLALVLATVLANAAPAQTPLHQRIDEEIAAGKPNFAALAAAPADDAAFLRRLFLDLNGRIPSAAEARAFLTDPAPDRRERLIDRLLAAPEYARHMQQVFDVLLMERRPDKHVPRAQWQEYLRASFA